VSSVLREKAERFMVHRSLFIVAAFGGFGCGFLLTMGVGELKIGVAGGHVGRG